MKILHVSLGLPPVRTGGLVRYCCDLIAEQVKAGHKVGMLYPEGYRIPKRAFIKRSVKDGVFLYALYSHNLIPLVFGVADPEALDCSDDLVEYELLFDDFDPDVIHVHSIQGIGEQFFTLAKNRGIRTVYTTHDYYPFCLRCNLIDATGKLCSGPSPEKCTQCNFGSGMSEIKSAFMQSRIYRITKELTFIRNLRKEVKASMKGVEAPQSLDVTNRNSYQKAIDSHHRILNSIDVVHANSFLAAEKYHQVFPEIKSAVIPITHKGLEFRPFSKQVHKPMRIGYVGGANEYKGYKVLLEALDGLNFAWTLDFYGTPLDESEVSEKSILCHGFYEPERAVEILSNMDVLVVPSIWPETFGFVALEAICAGTPVICSNLVGAGSTLPACRRYGYNDVNGLRRLLEELFLTGEWNVPASQQYDARMATQASALEALYNLGGVS